MRPNGFGPVVCGAAEREPDAAGGELAEDAAGVGHGPGEPVELGADEGVSVADGGEGLVEAGPVPVAASDPVVEVDPVRVTLSWRSCCRCAVRSWRSVEHRT